MKAIKTATLRPADLHGHETFQVYNGLDCCLTVEILEEISGSNYSELTPAALTVYNFERAMQAPALEMMLRGWRVNTFERDNVVIQLRKNKVLVQEILDEFAEVLWDKGLNAQSPVQMKEFFYKVLNLPEQYNYAKGQKVITTNREALENLEDYFHAQIFVRLVLKIRDLSKKISVLTSEVDSDGRLRTSYNVTGTETGRWSSSKNIYDGGTNLQNITPELRHIFIADPGKKLAYVDLSQAESRVVGFIIWLLFGDSTYLDACESEDLHTYVCRLIWEHLPWTGDPKKDRAIAKQIFYLHFSYRDMAKRGGHGTNYYGKPFTMAKHLKVKKELIEIFQRNYFKAFPGIPEWHRWVAERIQLDQYLESQLGMGRHFFGRAYDDATLREAIAYDPQSTVGQMLNLALWRIHHYMNDEVDCLGQVHDAVVIQYDEDKEDEILPRVLELMPTPLTARGRTMIIPSDVEVGWNWGKFDDDFPEKNPDGLKKWVGNDERTRLLEPNDFRLDRGVR